MRCQKVVLPSRRADRSLMNFNKGQVQSFVHQEEKPHAPIYVGRHMAGKQLCRKRSEGPGGQVEHVAMYLHGSKGQWHPELH